MAGRLGENEESKTPEVGVNAPEPEPKEEKKDTKAKAKEEAAPIENISDVREELSGQKKFKIIIPSTETEVDDVVVGVNGYTFQIKRDVPVEVPQGVISVLQDAKTTKYKQVRRKDGEGYELVSSIAQRFAFQTVM